MVRRQHLAFTALTSLDASGCSSSIEGNEARKFAFAFMDGEKPGRTGHICVGRDMAGLDCVDDGSKSDHWQLVPLIHNGTRRRPIVNNSYEPDFWAGVLRAGFTVRLAP